MTARLKDTYDVVIVGSGPSGASTAKALQNSGLDVVILEKCRLKRDKMCSGVILPSARKFLAEHYDPLPRSLFNQPGELKGSRCVYTTDPDRGVVTCPALDLGEDIPDPSTGFNVNRFDFDYWLCEQSGVPMVDDSLAMVCEEKKDHVSIGVKHRGTYTEVKAKFLVGADGPISRVRRSIAPEMDRAIHWIPLYEEHYQGSIDLEPDWIYWVLDPAGFGSLLNKDGILHLTAAATPRVTARRMLSRFAEFLKERHGLKVTRTALSRGIVMNNMPYLENYFPGKGRILLVGEAAGFLRALDGITSALVSGKAAGESILQSMASGVAPLQLFAEHHLVRSEWEACKRMQPGLIKRGFAMA